MKSLIIICLLVFFLMTACEESKILDPAAQISRVTISFTGLKSIGDSTWYELWILWNDGTEAKSQTAGVFSVDDQGQLSQTSFDVSTGYLQSGTTLFLTIEEDDVPGMRFVYSNNIVVDTLFEPSRYKIMAGTIIANSAILTVGHPDINDFDFTEATGTYLLDTPSAADDANLKSGIWFVSRDTQEVIIKGLDLPVPAPSWNYEGLVIIDGVHVSTGTFRNISAPDNGNPYSDSAGVVYNFPGEDFLHNAPAGLVFPTDLSGREAYIRLNALIPAKSLAPFELIPLRAAIPSAAAAQTLYQMDNHAVAFPQGTAQLEIKIYE